MFGFNHKKPDVDKDILLEVKKEITKIPFVYRSIKAHASENLNSCKLLRIEPQIFVGDMVTYIHAPEAQSNIMKKLIKKYGSHEVSNVMLVLFKVKGYELHDIDDLPEEDWREKER